MRGTRDGGDGPDQALRRLERTAIACCALMAAGTMAVFGRGVALGVVAGGLLVSLNYLALKGGVAVVLGRAAAAARRGAAGRAASLRGDEGEGGGGPRRRGYPALATVAFVVRYALLGVGAYVMLAHLHLHPVGVIAGASSPVAATAVEVLRVLRAKSRSGQPR